MKTFLQGATGRLGQEIVIMAKSLDLNLVPLKRDESVSDVAEPLHIIDVSHPEGTKSLVKGLMSRPNSFLKGIVIGTTGFQESQKEELQAFSELFPVCLAPNFSLGVLFLRSLFQGETASGKKKCNLWKEFGLQAKMTETHHIHKKDAPSGTAKLFMKDLGITEVTSKRIGETFGVHEIVFSSEREEIKISHETFDRSIYAEGAIKTIQAFETRRFAPGLYELSDIIL